MPSRKNETKSSPCIPIYIINLIFWYRGKKEHLHHHTDSILVTYCCIRVTPKLSGLKQQVLCHSFSGSGMYAQLSGPTLPQDLSQSCSHGVIWRLSRGRIGLCAHSWDVHQIRCVTGYWTGPQSFPSCWLEGLLRALPWLPFCGEAHKLAADFTRARKQERNRSHPRGKPDLFCNPVLEVTSHYFCYISFIRRKSPGPAHPESQGTARGDTEQ